MRFLRFVASLAWCFAATAADIPKFAGYDELNRYIKQHFDGNQFVINVDGLLAGEYQKQWIGSGNAGLVYFHWHPNLTLPKSALTPESIIGKKLTALHQFDARTFSDVKSGLNVTKLVRGETVRVNKFYMRKNYIDLFVEPLDPAHLKDLDYNKASKTSVTLRDSPNSATEYTSVAGFGARLLFYFDREAHFEAGDAPAIVAEISRYLLPKDQAAAAEAQRNEVRIDPGLAESEVLQRLGPPAKTIRVGDQTLLKYADMTVVLQGGKVAQVKVD